MAWHALEFYGFIHFTVNTFTDKEWGYGDESPMLFNPTDFDADQIAGSARMAGMKGLVLTAKHHDGFCLWPSAYTEHSVKNSPWRNGRGDVVREMADACRRQGLRFGVYLSPWDRNHADYARPEYLTYYRNQLRELLTGYGPLFTVWFDGANGGDGYYGGAREQRRIDNRTYYDWPNTWALIRELQPMAALFSDAGPDFRWVGNESGIAGDPCWATLNAEGRHPGGTSQGLNSGERPGTHWIPAECDVSIRPGWFYHADQDNRVKTRDQLLEIYYASVGRGCCLNLNLPPDRRGRIHENDVAVLRAFRATLDNTFETDLARKGHLHAALRNVSGGFPVSQSLTFFSYLFGLSNPDDPDPQTVWALLQTFSSPGIIEPGLYRVEGDGLDDLVLIGAITVQEFAAQNTLLLSCELDDLLGDPQFAAWFDPADPQIGVAAFTQRITLIGGAQEADRLVGGRLHLRELGRDPGPSTPPQLTGLLASAPGPEAIAEVVYLDAEAHCPVLSELVITGPGGQIGTYPLYPQSLDYAGAVVYRTAPGLPPLVDGTWTGLEARFSDDGVGVVTETLTVTAVAEDPVSVSAQLRLSGAPNPFTGQTVFSFELPGGGPVRLSVHDLAGRTIAVLVDSDRPAGHHAALWDGRDRQGRRQPAGVYLYRLQTRQGQEMRRITLVR